MVLRTEKVPIQTLNDGMVRQRVRALALEQVKSDRTNQIVTAASELGRNTLEDGLGGHAEMSLLLKGARKDIQLKFVDSGPGIPDIDLAMRDGYTSAKGMGLGLVGSKRLMR